MMYFIIQTEDRERVYQINLRSERRMEAFVESAGEEIYAVESAMKTGDEAKVLAADRALETAGTRFVRSADLQFVEERALA